MYKSIFLLKLFFITVILIFSCLNFTVNSVIATENSIIDLNRPLQLRTQISKPLTLNACVTMSLVNYPRILQQQALIQAAKANIRLRIIKEYMPEADLQYQSIFASHNKTTQLMFSSDVFPANMGPGNPSVSMKGYFFSGFGTVVDWAPLDFGLHKAKINVAKSELSQTEAGYASTKLDVATRAAAGFLDVVVAQEQLKASQANVERFDTFDRMVHTLVDSDLRPGADASLADAQLAQARNQLIESRYKLEIAIADLSYSIGLGGKKIDIDPGSIAQISQPTLTQQYPPVFKEHPLALAGNAIINTSMARVHVFDKMYVPTFHFLGGLNFRGAGLNTAGRSTAAYGGGVLPSAPNYDVAMIMDFPFLDFFRIRAARKVELYKVQAERQSYNLIMQSLQTEDFRAKAQVKAAIELAANMPIQVAAANDATVKARTRYEVGLGTVAQVAEAEQLLAKSVMQEASARIGVWKALLATANVHGNLKPFLSQVASMSTH